jgi:hypothetical protein
LLNTKKNKRRLKKTWKLPTQTKSRNALLDDSKSDRRSMPSRAEAVSAQRTTPNSSS